MSKWLPSAFLALCVILLGPQAKSQKTGVKAKENVPATQADPTQGAADKDSSASQAGAQVATTDPISDRVAKLEKELAAQKDSDFALQLGIGSLVRNGSITDYVNNANTLSATSLGAATPQYLVGVGFRAPFPNFKRGFGPPKDKCNKLDEESAKTPLPADVDDLRSRCPDWRRRPWSGFVSLKFASGSSETLNGYVIGGSWNMLHYMNVLVGFALTPVNQPSPGLRNAASAYVTQQQKLGLLTNFDPIAMQNNMKNAFDGFSVADSSGKLIYQGTPLETDYRGGVIFGVAIPINFSDFLKGK